MFFVEVTFREEGRPGQYRIPGVNSPRGSVEGLGAEATGCRADGPPALQGSVEVPGLPTPFAMGPTSPGLLLPPVLPQPRTGQLSSLHLLLKDPLLLPLGPTTGMPGVSGASWGSQGQEDFHDPSLRKQKCLNGTALCFRCLPVSVRCRCSVNASRLVGCRMNDCVCYGLWVTCLPVSLMPFVPSMLIPWASPAGN